MRLLIVDDEELTRNGILSTLDWNSLGISEVYQADDGINGLAAALEHSPDIILCDVRMPRMDGISMLERLESKLPDTVTIFMSGYSDKEYLKAAIKLKAVRYVEKPLDLKELRLAIHEAVERREQIARHRNAQAVHTRIAATQLAHQLTIPYASCRDEVDRLCEEFYEYYGMDKFKYISVFVVRLEQAPDNPSDLLYVYQQFRTSLHGIHLHVIYTEKQQNHIVFHVYGSQKPTENMLEKIAHELCDLFASFGSHYIAIGDIVSGIENAYHSYESAIILLQGSFFFEPGTILCSSLTGSKQHVDISMLEAPAHAYISSLSAPPSEESEDMAFASLRQLETACHHQFGLMPNQVKAVCYDMFSALYQSRRTQKMMPDLSLENHENIMDIMESCFYFSTLYNLLWEKTEAFFSDARSTKTENTTIYMMREYIFRHYKDPSLSVRDIGEYVHLSTSYACTFFKTETGTTLNQYITEYRMEKAKQLLADPRYRINDVAEASGYSDGNYFAKSFRKYAGLSPSEYREKVLGS